MAAVAPASRAGARRHPAVCCACFVCVRSGVDLHLCSYATMVSCRGFLRGCVTLFFYDLFFCLDLLWGMVSHLWFGLVFGLSGGMCFFLTFGLVSGFFCGTGFSGLGFVGLAWYNRPLISVRRETHLGCLRVGGAIDVFVFFGEGVGRVLFYFSGSVGVDCVVRLPAHSSLRAWWREM